MAGINFVKSKGYSESLNDSSSNTGKLYFPTDAPCIVMGGKEYGRSGGSQYITTLTSVPLKAESTFCMCSSNQTLTFAGTPLPGVTYKIAVFNSSSSSVTVTITPSNWGDSFMLPVGSFMSSLSGQLSASAAVSLSANHGMLITLTRMYGAADGSWCYSVIDIR